MNQPSRTLYSVIVLLLIGTGCQHSATKPTVDLLFFNGNILTMDTKRPRAEVVVVDDEHIVAVGDAALARRYAANAVVDLRGRTLMPGFIDSHIHISGDAKRYIDLTKVTSIAQIKQWVAAKARELGPGEWITGYGWSEDELSEQRRPLIDDLNAAAPNNPVMLTRAGGHSAACNAPALALANIGPQTANPDGGEFERGADGQLNGIIRERQDLVEALIPIASPEELNPSLINNLQNLFSLGITSIIQAQDSIEHYAQWQNIYAEHAKELPRAAVQVAFEDKDAMDTFGKLSGDGDHHLRVGAIKIFADGGFTGPAAYTKDPYRDQPAYRGKLNMSETQLRSLIGKAHDAGWQLGIHAIGDAAIELTVDALVESLQSNPRKDHRHYLNHFTVMPSMATMQTMASHGIAITQQPNFTYTLEGRYVAYLDGNRLAHNNPVATPMRAGIHTALSSDILPIGPMVGIYAAVTRRGMSGRVFGAAEAISVEEALAGYTLAGAYLTREETTKGSLTPGKLADMVILSSNPLIAPRDELLTIKTLATYLGGHLVYRDPTAGFIRSN